MVASFTKAAAAELVGRDLPLDRDMIGTLHAHCYRQLQHPTIANDKKIILHWNEKFPEWALTPQDGAAIDDPLNEGEYAGDGDELFNQMNVYRAKMIDKSMWPLMKVRQFADAWDNWKRSEGVMDFTDLIDYCYRGTSSPPGHPRVIFLDECFPFSQTITMDDVSQIPIGDVVEQKIQGSVLSFNEKTGVVESKKIIGWHKVPLRDRKIQQIFDMKATSDHPVFTHEFGYIPLGLCKVLACVAQVHVLQLAHENIQPKRQTYGQGAISNHWRTSWRCLDQQESRREWELPTQIRSRMETARIPEMEIQRTATMDEISDLRSYENRIRQPGVYILDSQPSTVHRSIQSGFPGWDQAWDMGQPRVSRHAGRSCDCSLVHGRRIIVDIYSEDINLRNTVCRDRGACGFSLRERNVLQAIYREERNNTNIHIEGGAESFLSYRPACSQVVRLQDAARAATSQRYDPGRSQWSEHSPLPDLQRGIHCNQISDDLRQGRMHQGTDTKTLKELEEEEYVYCIDVEDNHNFFAGGILVHNCQDMSKLEMALALKWGNDVQNVVLAADDDQAIFNFKGADPEAFLSIPVPESHERILSQSYRVPRAVQEYSQKWIKHVKNRKEKAYNPRDFEGEIVRANYGSWRNPDSLIATAKRYMDQGKSVMFLATCSYMLNEIKTLLRKNGIPFHNPYRRSRHDWNPLQPARGVSTVERLLSFMRLDEKVWGDQSRMWTVGDVKKWGDMLKADGVFQRGAKSRLADMEDDNEEIETTKLTELFTDNAFSAIFDTDVSWLYQNAATSYRKTLEFPLNVAKFTGWNGLKEQPKIILGTVHSVKGGESDVVFLFPDLSMRGYEEWESPGRDAIYRQFYVGFTRAKETLILCRGDSMRAVQM